MGDHDVAWMVSIGAVMRLDAGYPTRDCEVLALLRRAGNLTCRSDLDAPPQRWNAVLIRLTLREDPEQRRDTELRSGIVLWVFPGAGR